MSQLFYVLGAALLSLSLRSFSHPLLQRLGSLAVLGTSFLIGYFLSGRWQIGVLFASLWLVLPWLELVTRVRHPRMPAVRKLSYQRPPTGESFPALEALTDELVEEEGFEKVDDTGWTWKGHDQFLRLFYKADESLQAAICMVEQDGLAFYYVCLFSRGKNGESWMTWNYPFSYALKTAPQHQVNRMRGDHSILEIVSSHREFLVENGVTEALIRPTDLDADELHADIQCDMATQIAYNVQAGLLIAAGEEEVRYSWRGLLFIWLQFLRDFVRLK